MAATTPLVTAQNLRDRLGNDVIVRFFDHNNDSEADPAALTSICADASSKVRGALGLVYDLDNFDPTIATELKRLALDAAIAMTARDFPAAVARNWVELMQQVDQELSAVRKGMANLGTKSAPEPAANHGVRIASGNPDAPNCFPRKMSDDWGSF
jgi:phage gp36-like protein